MAKDRSGEQRGILPAEAFEPAREFVLPALEGVAGGSAKNFGLRCCFQRGDRDRTTFRVAGALKVRRHRLHDLRQKIFDVV